MVCVHIAIIKKKEPLNSTDIIQIELPHNAPEQSIEAPLCNQQDPKDFLSTSRCQTPQEVPYVHAPKGQSRFGSLRETYAILDKLF